MFAASKRYGPSPFPKGLWGAALVVILATGQGCASYSDQTAKVRGLYETHQYGKALEELDDSPVKSQGKNRLLYQLEKAQILDRMGKLKQSRAALMRADKIADDLYTTSISHQVASFVVNDAATEYDGEDFEVVAIHIALALSFIEDNDLKGALVEARKINSRLKEINQRYDKNKNRYEEDAFARLLAGIIYEATGNIDSAIIDYKKSLNTYDTLYQKLFGVSAPDSLVRAYYRALLRRGRRDQARRFLQSRGLEAASLNLPPPDYGRVVVIHEVSTINPKVNSEHLMPWSNKVMRFSFPQISPSARFGPRRFRTSSAVRVGTDGKKVGTGVSISLGGSSSSAKDQSKTKAKAKAKAKTKAKLNPRRVALPNGVSSPDSRRVHHAELVQDMNTIAHHTLEDRRGRIFAKSVARLVVKDQLRQQANKEFGPVAGLLVGVAGLVSETGDTRSWGLLPAAYELSEIYLPPGRHDITVTHAGVTSTRRAVMVRAGKPVFIRAK